MKNPNGISKIILIAVLSILVSAIDAAADRKAGYDRYPGMHRGAYDGPGCEVYDKLSEEEIQKLDEARTAFFEAARGLRRQIHQKQLELWSELSKENPSGETATGLQQEISDLKAQLAQKRLNHILAIRKINPDLGRRFGSGDYMRHGRGSYDGSFEGYGYGRGFEMGPGGGGFYGCPDGGPKGGFRMGPWMMGPGMMGPGYGRGPGMMGPGNGRGPGMMGPEYGRGPGMMGPGYGRGPGMMGPGMMGPGYGRGPGMMGPEYGRGPGMMGPGYGRGPGMMGPGWSDRDCPQQYDQKQGSQVE